MEGYIAISEETLDQVAEVTGLPRSFWEREMEQAAAFLNTIVVFQNEGSMVSCSIHRSYNIPFVMKQKFGKEPTDG